MPRRNRNAGHVRTGDPMGPQRLAQLMRELAKRQNWVEARRAATVSTQTEEIVNE